MNDRPFFAVSARAAAAHSRRASLVGLGAAVAALAASPAAAKKSKRQRLKKCKKQEGQCRTPVSAMCVRHDIPPEVCQEAFLHCCRFISTCDAAQALDCLHFNSDPA